MFGADCRYTTGSRAENHGNRRHSNTAHSVEIHIWREHQPCDEREMINWRGRIIPGDN
jgi:hypothetical protein